MDAATKLQLAGLRKLSQHANLESAVLPVENVIRLYGKLANGVAGEIPASAKEVAPTTTLDVRGYIGLCVHLAFYRQNPRFGLLGSQAGKERKDGAETVGVAACVKAFMNEVLPRMHKLSTSFASMLAADRSAQQVLSQYGAGLDAWRAKLVEAAGEGDLYTAFIGSLEERGIVGSTSITLEKQNTTKEASLTALAARHALIDAHDPTDVAFGRLACEMGALIKAVAL